MNGSKTIYGRRKSTFIFSVAVFLAVLFPAVIIVVFNIPRTAEYITLFGTRRQRFDICRALEYISESRRKLLLTRLLNDESKSVRLAAITAAGRSPEPPAIDDSLEDLLRNETSPPILRVRAGEVLLERKPPRTSVVKYLDWKIKDRDFRVKLPTLAARFIKYRFPAMDEAGLREVLRLALVSGEPCMGLIRQLILDSPTRFRFCRVELVSALEKSGDFDDRQFILSVLGGIDGMLRGRKADDWRMANYGKAGGNAPLVFEAEWCQEIKPNYRIIEHDGELCLGLGEGAGGIMSWLKGEDGTVDIGSARFSLYVPKAGMYRFWARVYFHDKCGNSFGVRLGNRKYSRFSDKKDIMSRWHWLAMSGREKWKAGLQRGRLRAWEDGVFIDKLALLPPDVKPDEYGVKPAVAWDESLKSSISFSFEKQAQYRGTRQYVTVWIRRNRPEMGVGEVSLEIPAPFTLAGDSVHGVVFGEGNPLCRTTYELALPPDAAFGEAYLKAVYRDKCGEVIEERFIIGAQLDWLTTGPLKPSTDRCEELLKKKNITDEELSAGWERFPEKGLDPFRRLNFENAYGQLRNMYIFLAADIEVLESGEYLALLTADDTAFVYLDGKLIVSQKEEGPGEGRLVQRKFKVSAGRHRIFVRHYQADFDDPKGRDRFRHSWNHCNFKLLLRASRHEPTAQIRGLPMRNADTNRVEPAEDSPFDEF